ncbi:MAG TPA: hypothetical protein VNG33_13925, partial [Polyangiaceae bacterium]|nr:hypothetical protein [Polyangiaceae bacterium]
MRSVLAGLSLLLAGACGSPPPAAYVSENDQAEASRVKGDALGAARHYERAAGLADKPRDAEEARYRAADAYAAAGDAARAEALYRALAAQGQGAERRARADFALAELFETTGREAAAQTQRDAAIRKNPDFGVAHDALARRITYLEKQGGAAAVLAYLDDLARGLSQSELGEAIAYQQARALDSAGQTARARDAYLSCADRYPYPSGAYWDDALFRAAEQELLLGAP